MNDPSQPSEQRALDFALAKNRLQILHRLERALEKPMVVLGGVWLMLMVGDLVLGLDAAGNNVLNLIWVVFILDFLLRFALAPRKLLYLRRNWLTVIALALPALRIFRFVRAFRSLSALRGLRLVRILGSVNRSMKALGKTMRRRGFGYVIALTAIVTLAGAAGMLSFEKDLPQGGGLNDFWSALWWTAMLMTTMGSEYWPRTAEGRALCLFLAVYAFAVFGYVTGTIATYFIGRDQEDDAQAAAAAPAAPAAPEAPAASADADVVEATLKELQAEVRALREELRRR